MEDYTGMPTMNSAYIYIYILCDNIAGKPYAKRMK